MIAVLMRFILLGVLVAMAGVAVAYIVLRWVAPLFIRGTIEENKAYAKWCRMLGTKPRFKEDKDKKKGK